MKGLAVGGERHAARATWVLLSEAIKAKTGALNLAFNVCISSSLHQSPSRAMRAARSERSALGRTGTVRLHVGGTKVTGARENVDERTGGDCSNPGGL